MNIKQHIEDLDLDEGQKYRGNCPECGRYNTFTATKKEGKLLWNCYANSCKISGATTILMTVQEIQKKMRELTINSNENESINIAKPCVFPDSVVSDTNVHIMDEFCERYGLDRVELDLRYDVKEDRIVFPMYFDNKVIDGIGRAINDSIKPKWKRYADASSGFIRGNCLIAVVVEDCISASVVETLGLTGIAILGTNLTQQHIFSLQQYKKVIVALDPDAAPKTIAYTKELKANGIDAFALKLLDDIKYRRAEDIQYLEKLKREFMNGIPTIKESTK